MTTPPLPHGLVFLERGWLSSNGVVFRGKHGTALVDSGYSLHAEQTVDLVGRALHGAALDVLISTHLHSDHCGGNAALQAAHPAVLTLIPPGQLGFVRNWDPVALSYVATGQSCEPFRADRAVHPGDLIDLGNQRWEAHAAPGHDPHSIVLFEPASRTLISADAFWENGFGVVFPELEGFRAFEDVGKTLDLVERLSPSVVLPGHGPVFGGEDRVAAALARARSRLDDFERKPERHALHAAKVLMKFKLLERQRILLEDVQAWARRTPYLNLVAEQYFGGRDAGDFMLEVARDLVRLGAAELIDGYVVNV
jgi:glyoxylase-like metal-dependent hydrolase (beta-lactamase superfamily II)